MNLLILLLFISVIITSSVCYDLEIEGTLKLGRDFLNQLDNGGQVSEEPYLQTKMRKYNFIMNPPPDEIKKPPFNNSLPQNETRKSLHKPEIHNKLKYNQSENPFIDFALVLTTFGVQNLQNATKYLKRKCGVQTDVHSITKSVASDFITTITEKVKDLTKEKYAQRIFYDYDKEYTLLNIVEISSAVFYRKLKIILDQMLKAANKTRVYDVNAKALSDHIYTYYINYKKKGVKMICVKFAVCREYPGFSDFFADYLSELLKLPRSKLLDFLIIFKRLLLEKLTFIIRLIDPDVFNGIVNKLNETNDVQKVRECLRIMRSIITARYKLLYSTNDEIVTKAKAARVLLDIFDKTFYVDGEDLQSMTFGSIVQPVRQWALDLRSEADFENQLDDFIKHVLNTMKHQWQAGVANEINVLTEILIMGKSKDRFTENYLLTKGSLFVRNKIINGDIQVGVVD